MSEPSDEPIDEPSDEPIVGAEGIVRSFDPQRGYGFIIGPDQQDVFAHYTAIVGHGRRVLREGALVSYDATRTDRGWRATRIERLALPEIVRRRSRSPRRMPPRGPPGG